MNKIHVNGRDYDLVTFDQLTLDEAMVVWDYSKLSLDQIPDLEGFHPGIIAALIHVSVARAEPDEKPAAIRKVVGAIPVAELDAIFADLSEETGEETELPPQSGPDAGPSVSGSNNASGEGSSPTGAPPLAPSRDTGIGSRGSDIGATSDRRISAA